MKIAHVEKSAFPYDVGGTQVHVHYLATNQQKSGCEVQVFSIMPDDFGRFLKFEPKYKLNLFRWFKMPWDYFGMVNPVSFGFISGILLADCDVIHCHSHLFFTSLFATMIGKIRRKKLIVTVHGVMASREESINTAQKIWLNTISRFIFKNASKIICLTSKDAEEIQKYGANKEKILIIPNGVDLDMFSYSSESEGYILWAGRFVPEKGTEYLINALPGVFKEFPQVKMVFIGDGPLKQEMIKLAKDNSIHDNCTFIPFSPHEKVAEMMKKCMLFVLPSIKEGLPSIVLEAMACGKPVITTRILSSIIGDGGITVNPASSKELEHAIRISLSNDEERNRMGRNARVLAERNYSWQTINEQNLAAYQQAGEK